MIARLRMQVCVSALVSASIAFLLWPGIASGQQTSKKAKSGTITRALVKLRPALAQEVETALPLSTLTVSAGQASSPRIQAFMSRHSVRLLTPLYRDLVRAKKKNWLSDREIAAAVRQKFAKRAGRMRETFNPPEISRTYALELDGVSSRQVLQRILEGLRADPDVEFAEENKVVSVKDSPNDPYFWGWGSWGQGYDDLWGIKKIGAPEAWDLTAGYGVVVAVVDTGIDYNHPDIAANIWTNAGEIAGNGIDDDGNGFVDDVSGWNFVTYSNDPLDDYGHGTHAAGTIAATGNNGIGVVGVAWGSRVMPVKALDSQGSGYDSAVADAIIYAAINGADVINNSWSGYGTSQTITDAVDYAYNLGAVIVASAGNESDDARNYYPANLWNVITVAATNYEDSLADFSNRGSKIDIAAPGVDILSLQANGAFFGTPVDIGYTRASGTSMAAAHVSGAAALILAQHPDYSNEQVRQVIRSSAYDLGTPGYDLSFGYGGLSVPSALSTNGALEAKISSPVDGPTIYGPIVISGVARGNGFAYYALEYGAGTAPANWTVFNSGGSPLVGMLGVFDPTGVPNGVYTIRLTAYDQSGRGFEDRVQLTAVSFASISSPTPPNFNSDASTFKPGATIPIMGSAVGDDFQNFRVEWSHESEWQTAGITLTDDGLKPVTNGLLATWQTPSVDQAGYYDIRLVVTRAGTEFEVRTMVYLEPDLLSANWPVWLDQGPSSSSGVVPALNRDGSMRLMVASPSSGGNSGALWTLTPDGALQKTQLPGYGSEHQPSVADLDGDGSDETVVADNDVVHVFKQDGSFSTFVPPLGPGESVSFGNPQLLVEDLDGDSKFETVAVGSDFYKNLAYIYAWRPDGTLLNSNFPIRISDANFLRSWLNHIRLIVGDIDGDGQKELVVQEGLTSSTYTLRLFGSDGSKRTWNMPVLDGVPMTMAAADLDHNGKLETILVSYLGTQATLHVFQPDGSERPGWPVPIANPAQYSQSFLAVGDLDRDGREEIVLSHETELYVLRDDGTLFSNAWPLPTSSFSSAGFGAVVLGDIDGDGLQEIVSTDIAAWSEPKLVAIRSDGTIARTWQLTGRNGSSPRLYPLATIGDFNQDGVTEIAVAYGLNGTEDAVPGIVTIVSTGAPFDAAANDWPMIHQNARNTAVLTRKSNVVAIAVSPAALSFEQLVNTTSSPQSVTVANTGNQPVSITGVAITGTYTDGQPAVFAQANNCRSSLAVGSSCTVNITFTATRRGTVTGKLQITDNAPSSPQEISISARGIAPVATVAPLSLTWSSIAVGSAASSLVTITNSGDADLGMNGIVVTGAEFSETNDCPASLPPSGTCSISVKFAPTTRGSFAGTLTISDTTEDSPQSVTLSGTGVAPLATVSPAALNWSNLLVGSSAVQAVKVGNPGNAPLIINGITISGPAFSQTNDCPQSLAPNTTCSIQVRFAPTERGSFTGTLSISDNSIGSPHEVTLAGSAVGPVVSLTPTSFTWNNVLVGSSSSGTVTLSNSGDAPLTVSAIAASGVPFSQTSNCVGSLGVGASCTITVSFTPAARGAYSGTITINDNAGGHAIGLSGTAIGPAASLSSSVLNFGSQPTNTTSDAQTITLSNPGELTLTISSVAISGNFYQSKTCGGSLTPGASCTITVTFKAKDLGLQTGALTISDNAVDSPQTVSLSGSGVDFSLSTDSAGITVMQGSTASTTVKVIPVGGGYPYPVVLSCSDLITGAMCSVTPSTIVPGAEGVTAILTISTANNTPAGISTVEVKGTSGSQRHTTTLTVNVTAHQ